ncbi:hypothetical protein [Candidatus Manganitrophus noduliformans]|uniref:Uncharacterized protein n=1 Tax=Candidatus Manganitrophus noduliformans TaxID=2606439 RepID=A0A7X6DS59_9BACT|nr:hypothetical protein [Candidatus Manganitrophus noduliformans]NKE72169.1 hypothetical protein [Candidatus Manganitrophus noduliformans]
MTKASLKLPNGAVVTLEGTPEEVRQLLELYDGNQPAPETPYRKKRKSGAAVGKAKSDSDSNDGKPNLNHIVTLTKECDEAETIETQILDRTAQVDRTLLPLYVVHEYLDNAFGLTSGEIRKITTDLGIPISQPNASRTLSGTASKYVIGDKVKVKGQPVRYKLSRRGVQYMKEVLAGNANG